MSVRRDLTDLLDDRLRNLIDSTVPRPPINVTMNEGFGELAGILAEVEENFSASSRYPIQRLIHVDNPLVGLARGALLGRHLIDVHSFCE